MLPCQIPKVGRGCSVELRCLLGKKGAEWKEKADLQGPPEAHVSMSVYMARADTQATCVPSPFKQSHPCELMTSRGNRHTFHTRVPGQVSARERADGDDAGGWRSGWPQKPQGAWVHALHTHSRGLAHAWGLRGDAAVPVRPPRTPPPPSQTPSGRSRAAGPSPPSAVRSTGRLLGPGRRGLGPGLSWEGAGKRGAGPDWRLGAEGQGCHARGPARVLADRVGTVRRSSWESGSPRASPPTRAG